MPNGDHHFDLRKCEAFFEPIADSIIRFAALKNLALTKYDHESPSWDLSFAHPIGGFGRLSLARSDAEELLLSVSVWKDDYDRFTRYVRTTAAKVIDKDVEELNRELSNTLERVLAWRLDDQFRAYTGYEQVWGGMSKEQFLASQPVYPVPGHQT